MKKPTRAAANRVKRNDAAFARLRDDVNKLGDFQRSYIERQPSVIDDIDSLRTLVLQHSELIRRIDVRLIGLETVWARGRR